MTSRIGIPRGYSLESSVCCGPRIFELYSNGVSKIFWMQELDTSNSRAVVTISPPIKNGNFTESSDELEKKLTKARERYTSAVLSLEAARAEEEELISKITHLCEEKDLAYWAYDKVLQESGANDSVYRKGHIALKLREAKNRRAEFTTTNPER